MKTNARFAAASCALLLSAAVSAIAAEINFSSLREIAAKRAAEPYRAPDENLPPRLAALNYDDWQKIEFKPERTRWRTDGLPFQVQFYPRGGLYRSEVIVHEFTRSGAQRIAYSPADYQLNGIADLPMLPENLGHAGFKVLFPLSGRNSADEVISFLGASYFRAIGAGQIYGLAARGLALDSGIEGRIEEFPRFSEFWLRKPGAHAKTLAFFALLEGPSVVGAYEFALTPGKTTELDIRAALFFRDTRKLVGIAPLTSMFWFGENAQRPERDLRPEVHDSDGLFVAEKDGPQTWRPLQNPRGIRLTEISVRDLTRFGLAQRDRRAEHYNDPPIGYERRPSAWVEPRGRWGPGKVLLAEIPATQEYADNIVAYWISEQPVERGQPLELSYRLNWGDDAPSDPALARVVATREETRSEKRVAYSIDFASPRAKQRDAGAIEVEAKIGAGGRLARATVQSSPESGNWRATVEVELANAPTQPVDLQCVLRRGGQAISETWRYRWERE